MEFEIPVMLYHQILSVHDVFVVVVVPYSQRPNVLLFRF
jgi:hypothetical protein